MFRLAHITDPHIPPLPPVSPSQLMGKRLTGWLNWRCGRHRIHDAAILGRLAADLQRRAADHIACTGDVSNLGLPAEWPAARHFLEELGPPDRVSFVPGNHDAYVPQSLPGLLQACRPYLLGDESDDIRFPYLRRRGNIALIGLSTAVPTPPFKAYGTLGDGQLQELETILDELGRDPSCCRIVMIHHPPYKGGTSPGRELKDAAAFEQVLARTGAELILFGHNHVASLAYIDGPRGKIPVIGAASASSGKTDIRHRASYHLYRIDRSEHGLIIEAERYGANPDGTIGLLESRRISPASPRPETFGTSEP